MTIIRITLLILIILGCAQFVDINKLGLKQRYVVFKSLRSKTKYDSQSLKQEIQQLRGIIHKDLRNHNGLVASINPFKIDAIKKKFDVNIEPDNIYWASGLSSCSEQPEPPLPPPPQPDQVVPWGIVAVTANVAWRKTLGEGIVVCVIDTGIDRGHLDLIDNILGGESFVSTEPDFHDLNGHGTHVSGTIAAVDNKIGVIGVAPRAKLYAVKVLDKTGGGYSSDVADGIMACINQNVDIISMSLGGELPSTIIKNALLRAVSKGIYVIAAAGNNSADVGYPAAYDFVIAISAIDNRMNLAWFSSRGPEIEFAAPGVDVLSTFNNGLYDTMSGTSMAAPHVSGVVALALSAGKSEIKVRNINLPREHQGKGLVDAFLTVE